MKSDHKALDKISIGLSALCMIHCLATPIFILSLPIMARFLLGNLFFHLALSVIIIPFASRAFYLGYLHHKKWGVALWGAIGILCVSVTPFLVHSLGFSLPETQLMVVGGMILVGAHIFNYRSCASGN